MHSVFLSIFLAAAIDQPAPCVEDRVELISVAHLSNGTLFTFWAHVQGSWTRIDHRWSVQDSGIVTREPEGWALAWQDFSDDCYRIVRADAWIETWGIDPLEADEREWWRQGLEPGLRQPPGRGE